MKLLPKSLPCCNHRPRMLFLLCNQVVTPFTEFSRLSVNVPKRNFGNKKTSIILVIKQLKSYKNGRFESFAEQLVNLTVKEVNELATILKEEYGIEPAAAAVAVAAGPAAGGAAAAEAKKLLSM